MTFDSPETHDKTRAKPSLSAPFAAAIIVTALTACGPSLATDGGDLFGTGGDLPVFLDCERDLVALREKIPIVEITHPALCSLARCTRSRYPPPRSPPCSPLWSTARRPVPSGPPSRPSATRSTWARSRPMC